MRFVLKLHTAAAKPVIPANYAYPLSASIYRILSHADSSYAAYLDEEGYGNGFKLFSFSQINCPFQENGDRLRLLNRELSFFISFHLPDTAETFIKDLFHSEMIGISDKKSKTGFVVREIEILPNPVQDYKERTIVQLVLKPLSPIVAGMPDKAGYDFLSPVDVRFIPNLLHNWKCKIASCYDEATASSALLKLEPVFLETPPKPRVIILNGGTTTEKRMTGWMNFELQATAERRFVELLLNAGMGLYNGQGMGYVSE